MVDHSARIYFKYQTENVVNLETGHGAVKGVIGRKMRLGAPDATGRRVPEEIDGSDYNEPADLVIKALGFEPEDLPTLWDQPELPVTRWGTIKVEVGSGRTLWMEFTQSVTS